MAVFLIELEFNPKRNLCNFFVLVIVENNALCFHFSLFSLPINKFFKTCRKTTNCLFLKLSQNWQHNFYVFFGIYFTKWDQKFLIPYWILLSFSKSRSPALYLNFFINNRYKWITTLLNRIDGFVYYSFKNFDFHFTNLWANLIDDASLDFFQWICKVKRFVRMFLLWCYVFIFIFKFLIANKWRWHTNS